jgi:hypothetical protein
MAAKKKNKKKHTKAKRPAAHRTKPVKKAAKKKLTVKRKTPKQKLARKKSSARKVATKIARAGKKAVRAKKVQAHGKRVRAKSRSVKTEPFLQEAPARRSSVQAGDLQGLSSVESAASESVDELLEEGNAFEADAVKGVEDADDSDEQEVHTHEVPEDDVPAEYLDED